MKYIYVICPVGSDKSFAKKRAILRRVAYEHGLKPFFPLERRRTFSVRRALSDMRRSAFVLADLSLERPSCYFELGLALAILKKICIIANLGTRIHQAADKSAELVLSYSDLPEYRDVVSRAVAHLS